MTRWICVPILVCSFLPAALADWPAFLGGRQRSSVTDFQLPLEWSPESGMVWQTPLSGYGQSSPVIVGSRIFVTAIDGPMKETNRVSCFDLATGNKLWQHESPSSLQVKNDPYTSRAAPTPVADSSGVFAFFESGNLIALDNEGQVRWQRSLIDDYGKYEGKFGLGGSLAQVDDRLFVLADNDGPAYLAAIDKQSGKTIWKTDRTSRTAWSSPMIIPVDGTPQVVVSAAGSIDGYSVETGQRLWTFDEVGGNTVASPVMVDDSRFLIGASPGRNGEASEGARRSNLLMKINKTDQGFEPEVVWINEKVTSSFGSPIAYQGHAYYTNRGGVVYCLDLATGETVYTARVEESNWATPIGVGDHVYFFGQHGVTSVLKTGDEEKIVTENTLWKPDGDGGPGGFAAEIQYGFAVIENGFIIRTGSRLFRIGTP
ncbi:PQQ-binding-like beta-propeller repeat protein [Stieleria sp. TO1_6]|uniref:outer membrane protein assembly factor BamB family protein n=1 Tax=Stieleria tagensis TaxID=2956795 RepID=UPI00209B2A85|nr:PQQ-binding-like beta-propeller repeat protein [Stieleria tagensis]MCO8122426.1 PQQ-binding-like beta-propeller repeat protein [Stieleria tagensis]